jgi:hypothetical protein
VNLMGTARHDYPFFDQSKLTYSFDVQGMHFAVINTAPYGREPTWTLHS